MKLSVGLRVNFKNGSVPTTLYYLFFLLLLFTGLNINREYGPPPNALNVVGVWTGIIFCCLSFFLMSKHLLHFMVRHFSSIAPIPPCSPSLNILERTFNAAGWIFLFFSFMVLLNSSIDLRASTSLPAKIIKVNEIDYPLIPLFPLISIKVVMEDEPLKPLSLFLARSYRNHVWEGAFVQIRMVHGSLGLPWVDRVEQDDEKMAQQVLKMFPKAVIGWKNLIDYYMGHQVWNKLSPVAREYLSLNPTDYNFLIEIATSLTGSFHDKEALPFYEYVVTRRPTSENLVYLGIGLHNTGNNQRSAAILEQAKSLDPNNWQIYYHLGVAYYDLRKWKESLNNFQKVLDFRPNVPQVEGLVADLKGKIKPL